MSGALVGASCEDDEAGFGVFADGKPADDDRGDDLLDMTVWLVESIVWVVFEVMVSADTEREGKLCVIVLCCFSRQDINSLANWIKVMVDTLNDLHERPKSRTCT